MTDSLDGVAIVYCEEALSSPSGKTAHGLIRHTRRYTVSCVVDSTHAGEDARSVIDGKPGSIPVYASVKEAYEKSQERGLKPACFVIGLAPDGGQLPPNGRAAVMEAIELGLNVDSGLHSFISEDSTIADLAFSKGVRIRDIRKPPHRKDLHFFTGKIEEVDSLKIAVLGTDSAVGKRTTAWLIVDAFNRQGIKSELVGTGQTAWLQGAKYSLVMDSLVNDFVSGEIENAVWSAWKEGGAEAIVIEGQGSLLNPAYPGGFEILAAGRPDVVVLQHSATRKVYDGFPDYPIHPLEKQIEAVQLIGGKPVVALTLNHEGLNEEEVPRVCEALRQRTGLPVVDVLLHGGDELIETLLKYRKN